MNTKTSHRHLKVPLVLVTLAVAATGCAANRSRPARTRPVEVPNTARVEPVPANPHSVRILMVNTKHPFATIDFASQALPTAGTRLMVYREGKQVGEVQITDPVSGRFATADILQGDVHPGDEAR